jgi:fructose-1,6-bisphosphatase/inositol monophosphatase family enzyme
MFNITKATTFAQKLTQEIGDHVHKSRNRIEIVKQKDIVDICTNIDKEAEAIAINAIESEYSDHNIFSEEIGFIDKKSEYTWYLDPLDGTKEYIRGIPQYGSILSLENKEKILLGAYYCPITKSLFSTSIKNKPTLNGKEIKVNTIKKLNKSFVYTHLSTKDMPADFFPVFWQKLGALAKNIYRLRTYTHSIDPLCWIAQGACEAYVNIGSKYNTSWHDNCAGLIMVEQAGGKVTDMDGKPIKLGNLNHGVVASNGHIHEKLLEIINQ